jgi:hypothetical protein
MKPTKSTAVSLKHMIGLVVVVVILVFGVTYTSMLLGSKPPTVGQGGTFTANTQLVLDNDAAVGNEPPVLEWHKEAHRIFWLHNENAEPVQVWLHRKSCKCTRVDACQLPVDWKALSVDEKEKRSGDPGLTWQTLEHDEGQAFVVPANGATGIRLNWKGEHLGPERLSAELKTQHKGIDGAPVNLEVPLIFVAPVRISPEDNTKEPTDTADMSVGPLLSGDVKTANFIIWSATRDKFTVTGEGPETPCVTFAKPEPLTKEECESIAKRDGHPLVSGYRLVVTVRESTEGGKRLDLGPFRRGVLLHSDADDEPLRAIVMGTVRGEINVGSQEDRDRIDFKSFEAGQEKTKEMTLSTDRNGLDLEIEKSPDFTKVELEPEELPAGLVGKSWRLRVTVLPNKIIGEFPRETSTIVLKTKGDTPRRVSIPVVGNVYVK